MPPHVCEAPGCAAPAAFRQMEPLDADYPFYLCVRHWNELRILDPNRAALYGSLKIFGPLESSDDGEEEGRQSSP